MTWCAWGLLMGTPTSTKNVFGKSFDAQINVHLISYSFVWFLHFAFFTRFEVDNFGCSTLDPQRAASEAPRPPGGAQPPRVCRRDGEKPSVP